MPRGRVKSVRNYEVGERTAWLDCMTSYDEPNGEYALPDDQVPIEIEFVTPSVFRFELKGAPEVGPTEGTALVESETMEEPIGLTGTERDGHLNLETDALTVSIGLEEWSFIVTDVDGEPIFREQCEDFGTKMNRRTEPLGFTAEQINQWPYRITDAGTALALEPDEHVYGFGEKFIDFDKRGRIIESWVTQPNGTGTEKAYKNVPFYLSTAGYGLLVDTDRKVTFDVGHSSSSTLELVVDDDTLSFFFIAGPSFKTILEQYTALTGRPPRPPKWSFGIWLSRCAYENWDEVNEVLAGMDKRDLPVDVLHLDPPWLNELCDLEWDREAFPDPEEFIMELHSRNVRISLWEYPYLLADTNVFQYARDEGYLIEDGTGKPYLISRVSWSSDRAAILDFTNPETVEWWKQKHQPLIEMGVDVFKTDFGEYLPRDAVLANGKSGASMRNPHPNLFSGTVYQAFREAIGDEALLWARSGWTGGQRYPVHWGGDPSTTFAAMAGSLRGGLSLGLSGYGFWSADIGGFLGEPSPELYVRWAGFGLLGMSHARFHGTTPREPWHFGEEVIDAVRTLMAERYRLIPYLYTLAEIVRRRGLPVMRPLVLEFQHDWGARTCADELMLGDALLVAPMLTPGEERDVYLPDGEWVDYWTGMRVSGPVTLRRESSIEEVPAFIRAGYVIPRQDPAEGVSPGMPAQLEIVGVMSDGKASGAVYDEDADRLEMVELAVENKNLNVDISGLVVDTVTVRAVESPLESVEIDSEALLQVDNHPGPGEWCQDRSSGRVEIKPE
jgi:alpha-D-xyloside xylohydrolase